MAEKILIVIALALVAAVMLKLMYHTAMALITGDVEWLDL